MGRCVAGLLVTPVAVLWQLAQLPAATPSCVKRTEVQPLVRWHVSHDWLVGRWLAGLALALRPLWQLAQVPGGVPV